MIYTNEQIDAMEATRKAQLERWSGYKYWGYRPVLKGVLGEVGVSERYSAEIDMRELASGDSGTDFEFKLGKKGCWFAVDAKGTEYDELIIKARKLALVTIYVLVIVNPHTYSRECVGWEFGAAFANVPREDRGGEIVHVLHRDKLRPMTEMDNSFVAWRVPVRDPTKVMSELSPILTGRYAPPAA